MRGKDDGYRWFLAQAVPIAEPDDDVAAWVGALTDIDDIRRADEAVRESEDRFRRIFEGSPFGITLAEGDDRRILQANPAFCRMLGYEPDRTDRQQPDGCDAPGREGPAAGLRAA